MDCSTADMLDSVVHDSPGKDSSSSDDFVPLSKLLTGKTEDKRKSRKNTHGFTANKKKDRNDNDDSSDDEPLIKMKTTLSSAKSPKKKEMLSTSNGTKKNADVTTYSSDDEPLIKTSSVSSKAAKKSFSVPPKKSIDKKKQASNDSSDNEPLINKKTSTPAMKPKEKERKSSRSNLTNNKNAELNTESSDNEPLIKIPRVSLKALKNPFSPSPKKSVDTKEKEPKPDAGSDEEPLSDIAKKRPARQKRASVALSRIETPVLKSRRTAARKTVYYAENPSDSSDDEPLPTIKKQTKAVKEQTTPSDNKKTKTKRAAKSLKDTSDNSSDDDVPLVNLVAKKKNTKSTIVSPGRATKKRQEVSDESSDDEPLINVVKKTKRGSQKKTRTKASTPKESATPRKPGKMLLSGSSSHPQVTRIVRIILERCDGEDAGPSLNKTKTETRVAEDSKEEPESSKEESEGSAESSEEE